jgi:hypothetical protein
MSEQPAKCPACRERGGTATGPIYAIGADHAGWICQRCYGRLTEQNS